LKQKILPSQWKKVQEEQETGLLQHLTSGKVFAVPMSSENINVTFNYHGDEDS
jgi:hypothetical protein